MGAGLDEVRAQRTALAHLAQMYPDWPKGHIQRTERKGPHYVVTIMPENKLGVLLFFVSFKVWVNASSGSVDKVA